MLSIVQDEAIVPLQGTIQCTGNSFTSSNQPFIPILEVVPSNKIQFKPCALEESVFQTIELVNKSDTPTFYRFLKESSQCFRVFPSVGIIPGKSF